MDSIVWILDKNRDKQTGMDEQELSNLILEINSRRVDH